VYLYSEQNHCHNALEMTKMWQGRRFNRYQIILPGDRGTWCDQLAQSHCATAAEPQSRVEPVKY